MNQPSNDYGLRVFFFHFIGACLIVVAVTMRLLSLPHLLQMHLGELIEIFVSDFIFFGGILLLFGRERVVKIFSIAKYAVATFANELSNIRHALQDDLANLLNTDIMPSGRPNKKN